MKKRILTLIVAGMMIMSVMAGCGSKETEKPAEGNNAATEETVKEEPSLDVLVDTVKKAYGEDYIPSMEVPAEHMSDLFGINMDDVDEFFAEQPMMSTHIDSFIVLKAKEGKVDSLVEALNTYRENQINNTLCYPMNALRVQGSQVLKKGNYAIYILLGSLECESEDEAAQVKFAEEQTQIGVDAINKLF